MHREATDLAGVRHRRYDTLGSTNAEALALARAGERGPLWISAATQTAGRGRRGRAWVSEPGNLYATLLLTEPSPQERAPQLSFVAALAVHDAIAACAATLAGDLKLKWPNDILLRSGKVGGLLLESENAPAFSVAVGIGVNCVSYPGETEYPATDLDGSVKPEALLASLSANMSHRLDQWQSGAQFAAIRQDWLARAAGLGETIRIRLPERELTGVFRDVDAAGRLLLDVAGKLEPITAGEVFAFARKHT